MGLFDLGDDGTDRYFECRQCGSTVEREPEGCRECGSDDVVVYDLN
jgi:primosomal protein N'